ncbi:hypothetical protein AH06_01130 [candidate division TM6 bacterium Zodletone_IIa]|nr:hypothetical protein AH06_01130 [candidate division TM6 bacterium Zodletone_IIa]
MGIKSHDVVGRQRFCLQHALDIVQLLQDFAEQSTTKTLDFDTAICAYHSARIILFTARSSDETLGLDNVTSVERARFCQMILDKYFARSTYADPMVGSPRTLI